VSSNTTTEDSDSTSFSAVSPSPTVSPWCSQNGGGCTGLSDIALLKEEERKKKEVAEEKERKKEEQKRKREGKVEASRHKKAEKDEARKKKAVEKEEVKKHKEVEKEEKLRKASGQPAALK